LAEGFEQRFEASHANILRLARSRLAHERAAISTMALAQELYLKLKDRGELRFEPRASFMAHAGRAMRSLLVDMARERMTQDRSAESLPLTLGGEVPDLAGTPERLVALDDALSRLGTLDGRLMQVAELRVIMGMEVPEISQALSIPEPTVKRDWQRAKAYLYEALRTTP